VEIGDILLQFQLVVLGKQVYVDDINLKSINFKPKLLGLIHSVDDRLDENSKEYFKKG
jgi:hypothetical protein